MRTLIAIFTLITACTGLQAQSRFKTLELSPKQESVLIQKMELWKKTTLESIKHRKTRKALSKKLDLRQQQLIDQINEGLYLELSGGLEVYNEILNNIIDENREIKRSNVTLLIHRSTAPNASYIGFNIIVLNAGILPLFECDDEAAFVLSHELAHMSEHHLENDLESRIKREKEIKKSINKLSRYTYEKNKKLSAYQLELVHDITKHSRHHEYEADSIGLKFFLQTDYSMSKGVNVLDKLDDVDNIIFKNSIPVNEYFNFAEMPFKKKWLQPSSTIFQSKEPVKFNTVPDSLKTHPNCKLRHNKLMQQHHPKDTTNQCTALGNYSHVCRMLGEDAIKLSFERQDLGYCLFLSLQSLHWNEDKGTPTYFILKSILSLLDARKDHISDQFLRNPTDVYNDDFKNILLFLQNISTRELNELFRLLITREKELGHLNKEQYNLLNNH